MKSSINSIFHSLLKFSYILLLKKNVKYTYCTLKYVSVVVLLKLLFRDTLRRVFPLDFKEDSMPKKNFHMQKKEIAKLLHMSITLLMRKVIAKIFQFFPLI